MVYLESGHDRGTAVVYRAELGRRAAHVESDQVVLGDGLTDTRPHQDAGRRSRFDDSDGIPLSDLRRYQAAARLHDEQFGRKALSAQRLAQTRDIAVDDGLHVSISHRRTGSFVFPEFR